MHFLPTPPRHQTFVLLLCTFRRVAFPFFACALSLPPRLPALLLLAAWIETWLWENSAWEGQAEKSTHQEDKSFGVFRKCEKSVVAQGMCPRQGVRDEDLSIAGMAEEITHFVEELVSLMEWISGVRGVDCFSHWQWVEDIFG